MSEVKWIKIATNIFDNRKIRMIESMPEGYAIIVTWLKLLCLAGTINDEGMVYFTNEIPYTEQMLATQFNMNLATVQLALRTFEQFGMIEVIDTMLHISNWEKYQNIEGLEKIREQNRLRNIEYRERKKQALLSAPSDHDIMRDITMMSYDGTDIDKELDIDIEIENKKKSKKENDFDLFWKAYPKKVGKEQARKSFKKVKVDVQVLIDAIEKQKHSEQWTKGNGQFIPNPSTWLNQGRWEDELTDVPSTQSSSKITSGYYGTVTNSLVGRELPKNITKKIWSGDNDNA